MITAETRRLIKSQISLVPEVKKNLPPLINDGRLTDNKLGIYGDAGALFGKVNPALYGSATGKRGYVSEKLFGDWSELTGDISQVEGCATSTKGDATGKGGSLNTVYGDISLCRDDITGAEGDVSRFSGSFQGIKATTAEIMDVLLNT